jgi:hypothetical protein
MWLELGPGVPFASPNATFCMLHFSGSGRSFPSPGREDKLDKPRVMLFYILYYGAECHDNDSMLKLNSIIASYEHDLSIYKLC